MTNPNPSTTTPEKPVDEKATPAMPATEPVKQRARRARGDAREAIVGRHTCGGGFLHFFSRRRLMTTRTTKRTVIFTRPFSLSGFDGEQPAGSYSVETDEELLDSVSFPAYRRLATMMQLKSNRSAPAGFCKSRSSIRFSSRRHLAADAAPTLDQNEFAAWRALNVPDAAARNADGKQGNMPWATFSRRPNDEGLVGPTGRRAPFSTHHGGDRPRRPLARIRWGHDVAEWAAPPSSGPRPKH